MDIQVNRIPPEGLLLREEIEPKGLDLDADLVKFRSPIKIEAEASLITNALAVRLALTVLMRINCSRCLSEFDAVLKKNIKLNYQVDKTVQHIDLNPDIREEIILEYPIKPLCSVNCKGLCPKCGKNLNEGGCSCGST